MTNIKHYKLGFAIAALFATSSVFAGAMSETEYSNAKDSVRIAYKADQMACESYSGNAKDVCQEKASGKERNARAQLESDYSGSVKDADKIAVTRADTDYETAKALCDAKAGDAQDVCIANAQAAKTKALTDTTVTTEVRDAVEDANKDIRDANYAAAKTKCDSLAGNAQASCVNTAKTRYGQD